MPGRGKAAPTGGAEDDHRRVTIGSATGGFSGAVVIGRDLQDLIEWQLLGSDWAGTRSRLFDPADIHPVGSGWNLLRCQRPNWGRHNRRAVVGIS